MTRLTFFAVGIDEYKKHDRLSHAVRDVEQVRKILGTDPELVGTNLTKSATFEHLEKLTTDRVGQSLVFYWAGHGESNGGLDLITSDDDRPRGKISAHEVVKSALESQASQQLYVFDVCHSGDVIDLAPMIHEVLSARQQDGPLWVGILTSCRDFEQAQDGAFGEILTRLLREGPKGKDLRIYEWSHHRRFIDGEVLGNAVLKEWPPELDQRPDFERRGDRLPMLDNPLYRKDAPPMVVEHLLQAARSGAEESDRSAFTGRVDEVNRVVGWLTAGAPGCWVVTGPAGTGKSAIVGRVVSLSNPTERFRLMEHERVLAHADPGQDSVAAHVYARGLTVDQVATELDAQLSGRGRPLLTREGGPRNVHQLLGDLQEHVESGSPVPCIVVDGLDEAGEQATAIAEELVLPLRRWATAIVSTREISTERGSLLDVLDPDRERLDLGAGDGPERTRRDVHAYLVSRLSGVSAVMDPLGVADLVVARLRDDTFGEPFLFARLLADHLRNHPIDTSQVGWAEHVALSYSEVFLREIDHPIAPRHGRNIDGPLLAMTMLTALTWSYGSGFPVPEWMAVARALLPEAPETPLDLDDVRWLLGQYGRFVIQDGEAGEAVYRLAHASLARALRPPFRPSASLPFDPAAVPIAEALLGLYQARLEAKIPAAASGYLWRHAAAHAAAAGPQGLELLSELVGRDGTLSPDLAAAQLLVADSLGSWGLRAGDVAPDEEAVGVSDGLCGRGP